ncbi:MAG: hypothetical protein K8I30_11505 [Anaerolineae bacterium]|nr:hypothetical protein [Anaerolineae bacterium]
MDTLTRTNLDNLRSEDKDVQNKAYFAVVAATDEPVDWAYDVWDDMLADLTHKDNHRRAIAAQVLCGLAKSDPEERMLKDFAALLAVTKDERFVTARHCLQALWKVGVAGKEQQRVYMDGLETRFQDCAAEKNCTLIRYDILQSLRNVYDAVKDETIRDRALAWMETEPDAKYRKKYAALWKKE